MELLGFDDARIRIINHQENLGELRNMNSLLAAARGRYFTWMADDDRYAPDFFREVRAVLERHNSPPVVLTGFDFISSSEPPAASSAPAVCTVLSGADFFRAYCADEWKTMACYGVFDTAQLRLMGALEPLCDAPVALYSEYLLLGRVAQQPRIAYLDAPLVYYRIHDQSWGVSNIEVALYFDTGLRLLREFIAILEKPPLAEHFAGGFAKILSITLRELVDKQCLCDGHGRPIEIFRYVLAVHRLGKTLNGKMRSASRKVIIHEGRQVLARAFKQRIRGFFCRPS